MREADADCLESSLAERLLGFKSLTLLIITNKYMEVSSVMTKVNVDKSVADTMKQHMDGVNGITTALIAKADKISAVTNKYGYPDISLTFKDGTFILMSEIQISQVKTAAFSLPLFVEDLLKNAVKTLEANGHGELVEAIKMILKAQLGAL